LLYHNKLTGSIPDDLFDLVNLEILFLSSNDFVGGVPPRISNLKSRLRGVYLSDNQLTGTVPEAICDLQQLGKSSLTWSRFDMKCIVKSLFYPLICFSEALLLDENRFEGNVPTCIGSLQQLK
jgi:hypothetical protein